MLKEKGLNNLSPHETHLAWHWKRKLWWVSCSFCGVCRDAVESVTGLYNRVEEKLHTLVMRSNESLQHLEFLLRLREMEAKISTVGTANSGRRRNQHEGPAMYLTGRCNFTSNKTSHHALLSRPTLKHSALSFCSSSDRPGRGSVPRASSDWRTLTQPTTPWCALKLPYSTLRSFSLKLRY